MCDLVCLWKWVCVRKLYTHTIWYFNSYTITLRMILVTQFHRLCVIVLSIFNSVTSVAHCRSVSLFQDFTSNFWHLFNIFFKGESHSCEDRGEGPRWGKAERTEGGNWLLQASREQDRWLDTGQSYTAKGCKRAMGKPCVNAYTHSHRCTHTVFTHLCNHVHTDHGW